MLVRKRPSLMHLCLFASATLAVVHCGLDDAFYASEVSDGGAVRPDGRASDTGTDGYADRAAPPPRGLVATQVVTGDTHSCAVDLNRHVYCWGSNEYGQLGLPLDVGAVNIPRRVELPNNARVSRLAAGAQHTCAVTERESLICWGRNDAGQLARPASATALPDSIVPPSALATASFVAVAAGRAHTCAIYIQPQVADAGEPDGAAPEDVLRVACWGDNGSLQLAREDVGRSELPADVRRGANAVVARSISLGGDFSVASLRGADSYRVQAWGSGAHGELGTDPDAGNRALPVSVLGPDGLALEDVIAVQAGANHACATVLVAASTDAGTAGLDASEPEAPDADAGDPADSGDAAVDRELQLMCWGANESGQLVRDASSEPERPAPSGGAAAIGSELVVGGRVTCLLDDFVLRCAGANEFGQLALGFADDVAHGNLEPVRGIDLPVVGASFGARHGCALLQTIPGIQGIQQVACWGDNSLGQLGDGSSLGGGYPDAAPAERHRRVSPVFVAPPD